MFAVVRDRRTTLDPAGGGNIVSNESGERESGLDDAGLGDPDRSADRAPVLIGEPSRLLESDGSVLSTVASTGSGLREGTGAVRALYVLHDRSEARVEELIAFLEEGGPEGAREVPLDRSEVH